MIEIKEASFLQEDGKKRVIYCNELTKEKYKDKYRGKLFCINGCKARISFVERTDGVKFFKTWKNENELHDKDCSHYKEIESIESKKRGKEKSILLSEDEIEKRFSERYKRKSKGTKVEEDEIIIKRKKSKILNEGEDIIGVLGEGDEFIDEDDNETKRAYIRLSDVSELTLSDVGKIVEVEGIASNIQWYGYDDGGDIEYAYLNFYPYELNCSIGLPEAYIKSENAGTMKNVGIYFNKVNKILERNKNKIKVSARGQVQMKENGGIKIVVFNPKELVIDYAPYTYDGILVNNF